MSEADHARKVDMPLDKHEWSPSPLPGQVVLVTTLSGEGTPNVAPKSWISSAAFGPPPVLMFGCNLDHATATNAVASGEFVVNIPGHDQIESAWRCGSDPKLHGGERFDACGFTPLPARKVAPPLIAECRAHIECHTCGTKEFGREVVIYGEVVSISADAALLEGEPADRYTALSPFFFLEKSHVAGLGAANSVGVEHKQPRHSLTILAVADLRRSVAFYKAAFGWPVRVEVPVFVEFRLPDGRGLGLYTRESFGINTGQVPESLPPNTIAGTELYFHVDDLSAADARLAAAGARLLSPCAPRDWGDDAAYYADPDGNVLVVARQRNVSGNPDT